MPPKKRGKTKGMPALARPGPTTRAANADKHPAFDTEDEKELADKLRAAEKQKALTSRVAEMEDEMRPEDIRQAENMNHPQDADVPESAWEEAEEQMEEEEPLMLGESEVGSEEEYSASDSDDDGSDEEEQPRSRKREPKPSRKDVATERKTKAQSGTPKVDSGEPAKRKASSSVTQKRPKKTKPSKKGGFAKPRAASSASGKSSLMAVESDSDDNVVRYGGPAIDEDARECIEQQRKKKRGKPNASDHIKVTIPPKPLTLKELRGGRNKWAMTDLPHGTAQRFNEELVPLARELMGEHHDPWAQLSDEQLQSLIDLVFLEKDHDIKKHGAVPNAKEPLAYRLNDWRSSIGQQAVKAIQGMIDSARAPPPDSDDEAYNDGVQLDVQENQDELGDEDEAEDEDEDEAFDLTTPEGLAAFITWSLHVEDHTAPFHWRCWGNGKREFLLSSKPKDHFSKDNWGDTMKISNGKPVKDKQATKYVATLTQFTDAQWSAIRDTASRWIAPKKRTGSSRSSSMDASMAVKSDEEDNFVLKADVSVDAE
ncbi:hypothetical protein K438DRAFT_2026277 [Mycena galopus ATCC 62051]|nr:hypothetical protein K438DRAFT_2026277 [Mycena galopus ATCC 62051]